MRGSVVDLHDRYHLAIEAHAQARRSGSDCDLSLLQAVEDLSLRALVSEFLFKLSRHARIRLSPVPSDLRSRQVGAPAWDRVETKCLVKILGRDLADPAVFVSRPTCQPAPDPPLCVARVRS
jgi:hypothetical protein